MNRFHMLLASLRPSKVTYIALFAAFALSVLTSQQAHAGFAPILVGNTVVVNGTDRVTGKVYNNEPFYSGSNVIHVYKGDTVQFGAFVINLDPLNVGGSSDIKVHYKGFNDTVQPLNVLQYWKKNVVTHYPYGRVWFISSSGAFLRQPPVTMGSGIATIGSDDPGKQFCEFVSTNPTAIFYFPPLLLWPYMEWKFPGAQVFQGVDFGRTMSCAEIAYVYNLMPSITLGDRGSAASTSPVNIAPAITQGSLPDGAPGATYTKDTQWQISQFFLPPGSSPPEVTTSSQNPCAYFTRTYKVTDCIIPKLSDGSREAKSNGFDTVFNADGSVKSGSALPTSLMPPGDVPENTVVCYALSINAYQPYVNTPAWRHSKAQCVTLNVLTKPKIQIHGGDLRVGRYFHDDTSDGTAEAAGIYTSTTNLPVRGIDGFSNAVFGSWVEYGALAPGPIVSFASLSGLAGGHLADSLDGCQAATNRLTFANTGPAQCGNLKQEIGRIPDVVSSFTSRQSIDAAIGGTIQFNESSDPGVYKNMNSTTPLTIDESTIKPGLDSTYVVYMPRATVKIVGDIKIKDYNSQSYDDIKQLPQLVIIAKNIEIDSDVDRIDAWLIANGTENNGVITTCTGFAPPLTAGLCSKQLYLNGPVMARELRPWRTASYNGLCDITSEADMTNPAGCVAESPARPNTVGKPAEIINLPASTLLWVLGQAEAAQARTVHTTELPPYF